VGTPDRRLDLADQVRVACAGIRAWSAANGYPAEREVELQTVLQWWAFESVR
jgi:hypothetical protein